MEDRFSRTQLLLGAEKMKKMKNARVAVFGVGGVGGYVVEALARSGVGEIDLIDNDTVCLSNINRQIIATMETVGEYKVDVAKDRVLSINPEAKVNVHKTFYLPETADEFDFGQYDYVVDAIDTVTGKIQLVMAAKEVGTPIICSMGAGNKLDPTAFEVADIYKTSICPLAKVMRRELKKRGVKKLKVVYSKEVAMKPIENENATEEIENENVAETIENKNVAETIENKNAAEKAIEVGTNESNNRKRQTPGSVAFVPSVVGLIIASEVIKDICES